jgi:transglutaminase-like putative cysteine protease
MRLAAPDIRVAVGRDYADVPPTRGVYKGASAVKTEPGGRPRRELARLHDDYLGVSIVDDVSTEYLR